MKRESYRLKVPVLATLYSVGRQKLPTTIPAGVAVTVIDGDIQSDRLVDVDWDGTIVMVFAQDLRQRGELVNNTSA